MARQNPTDQTSLGLPVDLRDELQEIARANDRTMVGQIRAMVKLWRRTEGAA